MNGKENHAPLSTAAVSQPRSLQAHQHSAMHAAKAGSSSSSVRQRASAAGAGGLKATTAPLQPVHAPLSTVAALPRSTLSAAPAAPIASTAAATPSPLDAFTSLQAKLDNLDRKYMQHKQDTIAAAVRTFLAQSAEDLDGALQQQSDELTAQFEQRLAAERTTHQSTLQLAQQQWSQQLQQSQQQAEAHSQQLTAQLSATQSTLHATQVELSDLQAKYNALQSKWKELKTMLVAKTQHLQSSPAPSSATRSSSPAPVPHSAAPIPAPALVAATQQDVEPSQSIVAIFDSVQTEFKQAERPTTSAVAAPLPSLQFQPLPPAQLQPLPLPQLSEDPFALEFSQPTPITPAAIPVIAAPPPAPVAVAAPPPLPLPAIAPSVASGAPAGNIWKSKKVHTSVEVPHAVAPTSASPPAVAAPAASAVTAMVDVAPPVTSASHAIAQLSAAPMHEATPALSVPQLIVPPLPSASALLAPSAALSSTPLAALPSRSARAVTSAGEDDDDCIVVESDKPAAASIRKRPALASRTGQSPPQPQAPSTWKPTTGAAAAARKRLRDGLEELDKTAPQANKAASAIAFHSSANPSPAKRQRPPVPIEPFGSSPPVAPTVSAHVAVAALVRQPSSDLSSSASDPHSEGLTGLTQKPRSRAAPMEDEVQTPRPIMSLSALLASGKEISAASIAQAPKASPPTTAAAATTAAPRASPPPQSTSAARLPAVRPPSSSPPPAAASSAAVPAPYISSERNRDAREALPGVACGQCQRFYQLVGQNATTEDGRTCEHVASRHRYALSVERAAVNPVALTPPTYWDVSSPGSTKTYESPPRAVDATSAASASAVVPAPVAPAPLANHAVRTLQHATVPAAAPATAAVAAPREYMPTSQDLELDRELNNNSLSISQ